MCPGPQQMSNGPAHVAFPVYADGVDGNSYIGGQAGFVLDKPARLASRPGMESDVTSVPHHPTVISEADSAEQSSPTR